MNARDMIDVLNKEICEVVFTKVDGTERNMFCTRKQNFLPERDDDGKTRPWDGDTVSVWDLESQGWRSFKASKVKAFKVAE